MSKIKMVFAVLGITLVACGGGGGGGSGPKNIEGTLSAPSGGSVRDSTIAACPVEGGRASCSDPRTKQVRVSASGRSTPYKLEGLEDASYWVLAVRDNDGDGQPSPGDYLGYYGYPDDPKTVRPPARGIDIQMQVLSGQNRLSQPLEAW